MSAGRLEWNCVREREVSAVLTRRGAIVDERLCGKAGKGREVRG